MRESKQETTTLGTGLADDESPVTLRYPYFIAGLGWALILLFGVVWTIAGRDEIDAAGDLPFMLALTGVVILISAWLIVDGYRFSVLLSDHGLVVRYAMRRARAIHWNEIAGLSFDRTSQSIDLQLVGGDVARISLMLEGSGLLLHRLYAHTAPAVHGSFFGDVNAYAPAAYRNLGTPSRARNLALMLLSAVFLVLHLQPVLALGLPIRRAVTIDSLLRVIPPPVSRSEASVPSPRVLPWSPEEALWLRELAAIGAYDSLESVLTREGERAAAHVQAEQRYYDAQASFWTDAMKPPIDAWVAEKPASVEARLIRASQFVFLAYERGDGGFADPRSRAMYAMLDSALSDARMALISDPNALSGYWVLLRAARDRRETGKVLAIALQISPSSLVSRVRAMMKYLPRSGGSYDEMWRLAHDAESYARQNPALRTLHGFPAWDRASLALREGDFASAERHLAASLAFGESYYPCLEGAYIFLDSDRGEQGLRYAECAVRLRPSIPEAQLRLGQTLYDNAYRRNSNRDFPRARAAGFLAFQLDPEDTEIADFWAFVTKQRKDTTSR